MKPIYIVIGILVIVLIVVLFFGNKASATTTNQGSVTGGSTPTTDPLTQAVSNMLGQTAGTGTSRSCRKDCDTLCAPLDDKLFSCGDRCQCKKNCEADCIKGLPYKTMYP